MKKKTVKKTQRARSVQRLVGPLDGTPHEGITANMGVIKYPIWLPITVLLKQIAINSRRTKEEERPNGELSDSAGEKL